MFRVQQNNCVVSSNIHAFCFPGDPKANGRPRAKRISYVPALGRSTLQSAGEPAEFASNVNPERPMEHKLLSRSLRESPGSAVDPKVTLEPLIVRDVGYVSPVPLSLDRA